MINVTDKETGEQSHYDCSFAVLIELCHANIESLLQIALFDSDEHIKELGGEKTMLELMNGYVDLNNRLLDLMEREEKSSNLQLFRAEHDG